MMFRGPRHVEAQLVRQLGQTDLLPVNLAVLYIIPAAASENHLYSDIHSQFFRAFRTTSLLVWQITDLHLSRLS
jgi:hypothetical protein